MDDLFKLALNAQENAYAPYSKHPVGAAIRAANGQVFAGCNVETAHYMVVHAEMSAISAMIGAGEREIAELVVVGPGEELCTPCGDCRQRIREFCNREKTVIAEYNKQGTCLKTYTMDELLPDSFGPENIPLMKDCCA